MDNLNNLFIQVKLCVITVQHGLSDMVSLVDSLVAPLSLINALIVAIASKREKEISETFANLERIWDEYDVYEKQVDER